jgi:tetratricopeptide (TPR) repeat protein
MAMAHWGMALAVGPNYNLDAEEAALKAAYKSIQKALELSTDAPEHEKAYIAALAKRYSADPKKSDKKQLARDYKQAMGELSKSYPDDLDAATLYAESAMNLRPWDLWGKDGKPAEGTEEILQVLESVLRRDPEHTGANHYYIHAIEASPFPERGLPMANRLGDLAPAAGHLVHMPAHIYSRVGDFAASARVNEKAAGADLAYITKFEVKGVYPMMYYNHNLHFLAVAHAMQGRAADARKAANMLAEHVGPAVGEMPMLEFFLPTPILVQVRFGQWDDILANPAPDAKLTIVKSIWHYARGLAFLAKSKTEDARKELAALQELHKAMPADLKHGNLNLAKPVISIALAIFEAKLALAGKDSKTAIELLKKAIETEDGLNYIEPADWHSPVREILGAAYLALGDHAAAEATFRADLMRNSRNPRSLFGLAECLTAQGKSYEAQNVRRQFERAWRHADGTKLSVADW